MKINLKRRESSRSLEKCEELIGRANFASLYGLEIVAGKGNKIYDADGGYYLDCLSAASCNLLGYSSGLEKEYVKQAKKIQHTCFPYSHNRMAYKLAKKLIDMTPCSEPLKVLFGVSGSDGCEAAIQAMRRYTGKMGVVSFKYDYHGSTGLSQQASGFGLGEGIFRHSKYFRHLNFPQKFEEINTLLEKIDQCFESGDVGGILLEPIQGDGGIIVPPPTFLSQVQKLCHKHNLLFMVDEVQSGLGRSGTFWAYQHEPVEPDLIVAAKGLSAGYAPISALIGKKRIVEALESCQHLFTYTGHPPSCAVALKTLKIINEKKLVQASQKKGDFIRGELEQLVKDYPAIFERVTGRGLMVGLHVNCDKHPGFAKIFAYRCLQHGIYFGYFGPGQKVIRIEPPLTITDSEVKKMLLVLRQTAEEGIDLLKDNKLVKEVQKHCSAWKCVSSDEKSLPKKNSESEEEFSVRPLTVRDIPRAVDCFVRSYYDDPKTRLSLDLDSCTYEEFYEKFHIMHQTVCQIIRTKFKAPSFLVENKKKEIVGVIVSERFDPKRLKKTHSFTSNVCVPLEYAPVIAMVKKLKHQIVEEKPAVKNEKTLHLFTVGVLPEYRRAGLGLRLIEATISAAREEGYKHILLEASTRGSQKIFKNLGFELLAEIVYEGTSSKKGSNLEGMEKFHNELSTPSYQGYYKDLSSTT